LHNHKAHNELLLVLMVVVGYVLTHMHKQLLLVMNYTMMHRKFDLQFPVEHQQVQLLFDKHKL
jgi:hypothetical protein